ncbi:hypothetical protein GW7_09529 [Heterocephalus glaber]|uniref:Solute carrier family 25 member 48 n=2 Tax=Heterocephalus glaber TaxID=10181 RepID=G5BX10_HETGA|nr:hypothetical protein GW7_09529 [Heterocephalus glaber]
MSLENCAGESSSSSSPSLLEEEDPGPLAPKPQNTGSTGKEPFSFLGLSHKVLAALECLPFFRTCEWFLAEEKAALQPEVCMDQGGQRTRQAPFLEDLAPPCGFFPYYRSEEDILPSLILPGQGHGGSHDSLPGGKAHEDCCCKLIVRDGCPASTAGSDVTSGSSHSPVSAGCSCDGGLDAPPSRAKALHAPEFVPYYRSPEEELHTSLGPSALLSGRDQDLVENESWHPVLSEGGSCLEHWGVLAGTHGCVPAGNDQYAQGHGVTFFKGRGGQNAPIGTKSPKYGQCKFPCTASVIVGHPLDTVKTRLQAGIGYGSTLSCIRRVYRRESVFGFFKGMSFPLASIAVYNSVVFGVFSNMRRFLGQHHCGEPEAGPRHSLSDLFLASMVAGVVSVGLGGPVDLIKIRLQMQTQPVREANLGLKSRAVAFGEQPVYQGPVHCIVTIVRTEGLAGLYRGASAMLLRDIPGYCLYFIPYVFLSEWITPETDTGPSPCTMLLAGGVAGAISWGTATPMDVVKSRLQADGVYLNKYKGVLDCISQSYQQEGLKVFFRGITVNAVRGFPASAAMFLGYELSLQALRGDHSVTSP